MRSTIRQLNLNKSSISQISREQNIKSILRNFGLKDEEINRKLKTYSSNLTQNNNNNTRTYHNILKSMVFSTKDLNHLKSLTDFRQPSLKFSSARALRRKIICHLGPTNSGKTHKAILALSEAKTGLYAGPLRLLAHEIFVKLNQGLISPGIGPDGNLLPNNPPKACNLITGEDIRIVDPNSNLKSCTVEMIPLESDVDVAVIDEIQLIGDANRGQAWTNAMLGLRAKEIHVCGEETVIPLLESMAKETGDEIVINRYKRLSPFKIGDPILSLKNVRKGDCVVTFSRSGIWEIKRKIESMTGLKCAVAYGGLPPETRAEQAKLFNDVDSGYDVMVASDAIGMGLNLKIKRVIFETVHKWNGKQQVELSVSQLKQIAGRAGRYNVNKNRKQLNESVNSSELDTVQELENDDDDYGIATTLHSEDLPILANAINSEVPLIKKAAIGTTNDDIQIMSSFMPRRLSLGKLMKCFNSLVTLSPNYFLTNNETTLNLSEKCEEALNELNLDEAFKFSLAPANIRDTNVLAAIIRFANLQSQGETIDPVDCLQGLGLNTLTKVENLKDGKKNTLLSPETLTTLESLHRILVLYNWLSFRFGLVYIHRSVCQDLKQRCEECIEYLLNNISWDKNQKKKNNNNNKHSNVIVTEGLPE